jgi:4-hydroxythreonine-4-phosphate dehydrogenase
VGSCINREAVLQKICFTHGLLLQAGIERPKIAVSALNPHAGENGLFGDEEIESIAPAIAMAGNRGIDVEGPFPADTIFLKMRRREYQALVSMYHDQAQIGMKLLSFERGVTINSGLPVILTTPAHGTAFDIAGKGEADPQALFEAVRMACRLLAMS